MLPAREGRFLARVLDRGVDETGPNDLLTCTCDYHIVHEQTSEGWADVPDDWRITGYHYLVKRDGSINESTIKQLKAAFGWDGRDPFIIQEMDLPEDHLVQITVAMETYNGQTKPKVNWVDSKDATGGGVSKADDQKKKALASKYGSQFRAAAGGTPVAAPKTTGKPAVPQAKPAAPVAPAKKKAAPKPSTQTECWEMFTVQSPDITAEERSERWWAAIEKFLPGCDATDDWTPEQWGKFRDAVDGIPF